MNEWFRENRWLGTFLLGFGLTTLLALWFLFYAKGNADDATAEFNTAATERHRLEGLNPFPSEANYRKFKVHIDNYAASLAKLKENLKTRAIAAAPMAPNEFQSRLRQAMMSIFDKARANRVKLPENFALGFEEFTAALPKTEDAPVLGQELAQAELLATILIDARVDAIRSFKRLTSPPTVASVASTPSKKSLPANAPKTLERGVVDLSFTAAPSVLRRVLNQIANSPQQFFVMRTVHVRNEKDKGPAREQAGLTSAANPASTTTATKSNSVLSFIVGNEHVETSARVEMVRFVY